MSRISNISRIKNSRGLALGATAGAVIAVTPAFAQQTGVEVQSGDFTINANNQAVITQGGQSVAVGQGQYFIQNGVLHVNQAVAQTLAQQGIIVGSNVVTAAVTGQLAAAAATVVGGGGALLAGAVFLGDDDDEEVNEAPVFSDSAYDIGGLNREVQHFGLNDVSGRRRNHTKCCHETLQPAQP